MNRRTDLTESIDRHVDSRHLNAALFQSWEWQGHRRVEVYTPSVAERRLRRREQAEAYGIHLKYDGD